MIYYCRVFFFFFQAEDGIRDYKVTGVQTCALPICGKRFLAVRQPGTERYLLRLGRADRLALELLRLGDPAARQREHLYHAGRRVVGVRHAEGATVTAGVLSEEEVGIVADGYIGAAAGQCRDLLPRRTVGLDVDGEAGLGE